MKNKTITEQLAESELNRLKENQEDIRNAVSQVNKTKEVKSGWLL